MSVRALAVRDERWPIRGGFRIARGAKSEAHVVIAEIREGGSVGRGECVPYPRYGESVQGVCQAIEAARGAIEAGADSAALHEMLPPGAARNALDCALIDLEAKRAGLAAWRMLELPRPRPVRTAFTLSVAPPDVMAAAAGAAAAKGYGLLKLKAAGEDDLACVAAVRAAAPQARLVVDANEGWTPNLLAQLAPALAKLGVALIEQPLPAGSDDMLQSFDSPVPLCADESCHTARDLDRVAARYAAVNIKLDKTGGLHEAAALAGAARARNLRVMIGCMVATSLAMAPAALLAPLADFVDLDGPLLLERDRVPGLVYRGDVLEPPAPALWG